MRSSLRITILLGLPLVMGAASCTGGKEETVYACSYEERKTDGCDGMGFQAWEGGCYSFDSEDYVITPEEVCGNVTQAGLFCDGGCCIDYEYRNVLLQKGTCP